MTPLHIVMGWNDWVTVLAHYMMLSLISVGGAISTSSEMHRFLVEQHHWLTQQQFNDAIAIAQAAPGPNVLFVALMGWHVGLNAGGVKLALLGAALMMFGLMTPSTILTYLAAQWGHRNRQLRAVRAFKQGMAPIVIALLLSTAWIIGSNSGTDPSNWPLWLLSLASMVVLWRTRLHILWVLGAGALLGALHVV
jgi:chromate transporter